VTAVSGEGALVDARLPSPLNIHLGMAGMGYGWVFPRRGYYSVGICILFDIEAISKVNKARTSLVSSYSRTKTRILWVLCKVEVSAHKGGWAINLVIPGNKLSYIT
jgi:flavin-dependent dehydrogenase